MALLLRWLFVCLVFDEVAKAHNPHDNVDAMAVSLDGQHVWISSRHKVYRSEDFGLTWVSAHGAGLPLVMPQGGAARLALSPGYARGDWSACLCHGRKLYHTRDQLPAVAVELVRRARTHACTHAPVHRYTTHDAGVTWARRNIPINKKAFPLGLVLTQSNVFVIAAGRLFLAKTTNDNSSEETLSMISYGQIYAIPQSRTHTHACIHPHVHAHARTQVRTILSRP